jgi:hypothetical protein
VALVLFEADFLAGLQRHDDQLAALGRVEDFPEIIPGKRFCFDVDAVTRHDVLHEVVVRIVADSVIRYPMLPAQP